MFAVLGMLYYSIKYIVDNVVDTSNVNFVEQEKVYISFLCIKSAAVIKMLLALIYELQT